MQHNMNINEKILILILILIITILISYFSSSFNIIEGNEIYKIDNKKAGNQIKQNTEQEKKEKEPGIRANENTYINMHDKAFI